MIHADVTIIGGGPAGAVTGRILAEKGYQVVILEKSTFPRDKVCGCCLNERAVQLLLNESTQKQTYFPPHLPQKKIVLVYEGKTHSMSIPGGIIISRSELDSFLIDNAKKAGCKVYEGVKAHVDWPDTVVKGSQVPELSSRIVCLASGLGSNNFQRDFFGRKKYDNKNAKIGLGAKACVEDIPYDLEEGVVRMYLTNEGYLGETRLADGTVAYGAAIRKNTFKSRDSLSRTMSRLFSLPHIEALEWSGTPILESTPESVGEGLCIRIGDAAGYIEPFTGQGMTWAIQSAVLAADLISEELQSGNGKLSLHWKKLWHRKLWYSRRFCKLASILASHPSYSFPLITSPLFPAKMVVRMLYGEAIFQ
jgi:flavin-dependent dehydrogenase